MGGCSIVFFKFTFGSLFKPHSSASYKGNVKEYGAERGDECCQPDRHGKNWQCYTLFPMPASKMGACWHFINLSSCQQLVLTSLTESV